MLFVVSLFTTATPSKEIIEERIEFEELCHNAPSNPTRCVLARFTRRAAREPWSPGQYRVTITWFEDQGDIDFPMSFLTLVADRKWPVTLGLND